MQQRISFITLGVQDLAKMQAWYVSNFGWEPMKDDDGICFFKLNGSILALFPADELAKDIGIQEDGTGFKRVTMAINFGSIEEVDAATQELRTQGVRIVREPEKVFWGGYRGYIADPEDNYWELAYNPFLSLDEEGNVI